MELKKLNIIVIFQIIIFTAKIFIVVQPGCIEDERTALLRFKANLVIKKSASKDPSSYPKTSSWSMERGDCCSWDGVSCDKSTGHVISLNLNCSFLYGSIDSKSTIFYLTRLERLNLADNNFNFSRVPPELGKLLSLSHLNLSTSSFVGLPLEISLLANLSSLDLSYVNVSSQFPDFFMNFSSLTHLVMKNCGLYGEFPEDIFHLPKLEFLNMQHNPNLTGRFPKFKPKSNLKTIWFCRTNFSGSIPSSIENLKSLEFLSVARTKLSGFLPSSIGRLINITYLDLSYNNFIGEVPKFLQNFTKLNILWLGGNQLTGEIPLWIGNLTELSILSLARNKLSGSIPQTLSKLKNLRTLNLFENKLSGMLDFERMFNGMGSLVELRLDGNNLSVTNVNGTFGKFEILGMSFCNIGQIPNFLKYQEKLRYLDLGGNNLCGPLPKWIWNTSKETISYLALNDNCFVSINEIEELFCNLPSLQLLDLSNNLLSHTKLPKCLEKNPNNMLSVLNLRNNSFHGVIPEICSIEGSALKMVDLSYNKLVGSIPISMRNCLMLESLNVGNNQLFDVFPWWLVNLPSMRLLILRSNKLQGEISCPKSQSSNLRVIDVSHNNFSGKLPSECFDSWNAMKIPDSSGSYLKIESSFEAAQRIWFSEYMYSTTITIKGTDVRYGKIQEILVFVDLSSNNLWGEIPDSIGNFQGLRVLNLSNNFLSGKIPSSLGNLMRVESLDLSRNELSGEIPQSFVGLTFLSFFDVSHNQLEGRIPRGNQLNTFENSSYSENAGLCGDPLSKKCGDSDRKIEKTVSDSGEEENDHGDDSILKFIFHKYDWVLAIGVGYLIGVIFGVIVEKNVMTETRELWLAKIISCKKIKNRRDHVFF